MPIGIKGHDHVNGINDSRHVSQNRQQQTDAELQAAASIAKEDAERREQDCN